MTTPRIRASAIIIKNSQVLLISKDKDEEEYWVFPGGHIEDDEDRLHAAIRKIKEETSLDVIDIIDQQTYSDPDDSKFKHFCVVCEVSDPVSKTQPQDNKWHNISDALKIPKLYPTPVKNHLRDMNHETHRP